MASIKDSIFEIRILDELSHKNTVIHRIHPISKLFVTIIYILSVISYDKYEINNLFPFIIYPMVIFTLGDIPTTKVFKRMVVGMFFVVGVGIFNPLLDKSIRIILLGLPIAGGWISFVSLVIKGGLTILAALLLLATTGIDKIALALSMIKVPNIFILQFLLTFRYISLLAEEINKTYNAYMLRAPGHTGIHFKAWGSLCGQIIMDTFDRSQKIYDAMMLRGFRGEYNIQLKKPALKDIAYIFVWMIIFMAFKFTNIPAWIGAVATGVIR